MEVLFTQKNLTKEQEGKFIDYVNQKLSAFQAMFLKFSNDSVLLKVQMEKFEKHDAYEVEMVLSIPNKKFYAKETSHHITKSVDLAKDRLVSQLKNMLTKKVILQEIL